MFFTRLTFLFVSILAECVWKREAATYKWTKTHTHTQHTQKSRHLTKAICWARGSHPAEVWHCVTEHCGSGKKVNTARSALHLVWKAYNLHYSITDLICLRHVHGSAAFDAWCDWKLLIGSSFHLLDTCLQQFTWKKGERNYFDADWKWAQRLNWSGSQHFSGSHAVFVYICHISEVFNLINCHQLEFTWHYYMKLWVRLHSFILAFVVYSLCYMTS